jgi:hypothetical protein
MAKTGPNDVGNVVWTLREFFFSFYLVFLYLYYFFIAYLRHNLHNTQREKKSMVVMRKTGQTMRLASFGLAIK